MSATALSLAISVHAATAQPLLPPLPQPAPQSLPETAPAPVTQKQVQQPAQNPTVDMSGPRSSSRAKELDQLFAELRKTSNLEKSHAIASRVRRSLQSTGSDSADLILRWAETALNQSQDAQAEDFLDEAKALIPDHASVWELSSRLHLRRNQLGDAMRDMQRALLLEPRNFDVMLSYATLLHEADKPQAAAALYQQALSIYPMFKQAQNELLKLTEETTETNI